MYVISVSVAKECTYYVSLAGLSMCAAESALVLCAKNASANWQWSDGCCNYYK